MDIVLQDTFTEPEPACGPNEMTRADRAHPEQHPENIVDDDAVVHALQCSEPDDELDEMIRAKITYLQQHPEEIMDADAVVDVLCREVWACAG